MGAAIGKTIKSLDGGDAAAQETRDTLNSLYALGQSRVDAAYAQATSDRGNMYAPISKVILRRQQIVCKTSTDTNGIAQGIKDSVGKLMNGQILDGVVNLIQNGMNIVLGQAAGQISSTYTYALVATDIGGLLRIDVDIYNFALQSQGLQTKVQNMTAISSLISSINPQSLTASDLRAVISVSYGGSPVELQKSILALVMEAWKLDQQKAAGAEVTDEDLAKYRSLIVPSKYDALEPRLDSQDISEPAPAKVDRKSLERAFARLKVSSGKKLANGEANGEEEGVNGAKAADDITPIRIWIKLQNPAEDIFITWLEGMMNSMTVPGIFKFIGIDQNGYSGDAISLNCNIETTTGELFEKAINYVEDTVLYCLSNAGLLTKWISTMAVQYKHPGKDASGFVSQLMFKKNAITNSSTDTVEFLEAASLKTLLKLAPGAVGNLTGAVDYVVGPVQAAQGPGTQTPLKWVTYDSAAADKILTTMPITLQNNPSGGYALTFIAPDNQSYSLRYSDAFPR